MGNLEIIYNQVRKHGGELVIDGLEIVRLINMYVGEDDFYYEMYSKKRGKYHTSCVGCFVPLRGQLEESAYRYLEQIFVLNSPGSLRLKEQKCPKCGETKLTYNPIQHIVLCPVGNCDHIEYNCNIVGVAGQPSPQDIPKPYGI